MKYTDGTEVKPGDTIEIDGNYRGRVIASMDTNEYLPNENSWAYLGSGMIVDTDFAGLVHFPPDTSTQFKLLTREPSV